MILPLFFSPVLSILSIGTAPLLPFSIFPKAPKLIVRGVSSTPIVLIGGVALTLIHRLPTWIQQLRYLREKNSIRTELRKKLQAMRDRRRTLQRRLGKARLSTERVERIGRWAHAWTASWDDWKVEMEEQFEFYEKEID
jgi:uncharacterized protein (DUF2384 family)